MNAQCERSAMTPTTDRLIQQSAHIVSQTERFRLTACVLNLGVQRGRSETLQWHLKVQ